MADSRSNIPTSDDGLVSERVVEAVAEAREVDPLDLPPLYDVVDPDALNRLFEHEGRGASGPGRVIFTIDGCEVVVHSDGEVDVSAPAGGTSPTAEISTGRADTGATLEQDD